MATGDRWRSACSSVQKQGQTKMETFNTYSANEIESVTADTTELPRERRRAPTPAHRLAASGSDGITAFMKKFAVSPAQAETVAPATRDFLKASLFLFRQ
jgi:hypothetical protein